MLPLKIEWCHAQNLFRITNSSDHERVWTTSFLHKIQLPNPLSQWLNGLDICYYLQEVSNSNLLVITGNCYPYEISSKIPSMTLSCIYLSCMNKVLNTDKMNIKTIAKSANLSFLCSSMLCTTFLCSVYKIWATHA